MNIDRKQKELWDSLSHFVREACADRDASHGHEHMEKVALLARQIFLALHQEIKPDNYSKYQKTVAAAWLHDVADHKYDPEGIVIPKINTFLLTLFSQADAALILNIIERVSYSKENKAKLQGKKLDWEEVLGREGCEIRDIVSDADKLEAIGKGGIVRCKEYAMHQYQSTHGNSIPPEVLVKQVIDHANEKLLRLKDEFIRTKPGKEMAVPLHQEMENELEALKANGLR